MTTFMRMDPQLPAPLNKIKIAEGVSFDDKHADRFVDRMLLHLDHEARKNRAAIQAFQGTSAGQNRLGNPKSQVRWFNRVRAVTGSTLLFSMLETGTRGKFFLFFVDWTVKTPKFEAAGPAERRWLWAIVTASDSQGGSNIKSFCNPILAVTHHALRRAIQRAEITEPHDFAALLKRVWLGLQTVILSARTKGRGSSHLPDFGQGWPIPFRAPSGKRLIMVLKRMESPIETGLSIAVVPTIVDSETANRLPIYDEIEAILDLAAQNLPVPREELLGLLETASKLGY